MIEPRPEPAQVQAETVVDTTRRVEGAVRGNEAHLAAVADIVPVLIWFSVPPEVVQYANRAASEFFGVGEEGLLHCGWAQFVHPGERDNYVASYRDRSSRRERFEAQVRLRRADGEYRWMKSIALSSGAAESAGYVICCFDIEDLKHAEESLRQADGIKNRFIAVLGHELRNPLAAVRNSVEAIALSRREAGVLQRALEVIDRQSANMVRIVDDLLDISRITHGLLALRQERVDAVAAVHQAVAATDHLRQAANLSIRVDAPDHPLWVDADPVRLEQVFGNLLVNASKFTHTGGHVKIIVAKVQDQAGASCVSIRVIDDGIGVDPAHVDRMFELFVQGETKSRANGMGLGLPLTRQLVELHGGSIVARSEGEGKGLEIEIRLKILAE